jgi:nucleotide-binding universal stress UspA family protein
MRFILACSEWVQITLAQPVYNFTGDTMNTHVPLRSLLVATNLEDTDWLLPLAAWLAEESGASVTLLHVLSVVHGFTIDQGCEPYYDPREAIAAASKEILALCERVFPARIRREVLVLDGSPADNILATARESQADLLLLGTACHRGVEKWLVGSVAETVLRSASIPVLTVGPHARRAAASGRAIQSILFAASLNASSAKAAEISRQWAERLHGHLTLLHVIPDEIKAKLAKQQQPSLCEQKLRSLLTDEAFQSGLVDVQLRTGNTCREILAAAEDADLLILGAEHKPLLGRLAREGTLHRVLAEARCPVASFHHDRTKPSQAASH